MVNNSYDKPAYERLRFYQNICEIRRIIYQITKRFEKSHLRLVGQMRDAARSAKQNIREGYRKDSAGEFARYIKISAGSLEELEGDVDDCREDRLVTQVDQYLDSLYRMQREGRWKQRFKSKQLRTVTAG